MSENSQKPEKLPVEEADLPTVDDRVLLGICLEHHHSILQFAVALAGYGWNPLQIEYVAARWTWPMLANAVACERQKREKEMVPASFLAEAVAQRAEHPEGVKVRPQPPEPI